MDQTEYARLALLELPAVYRLAYHLAPCKSDVDDLVQETYLHALRAADHFELQAHGIRPWLFKILHNVVNARLGKQQREEKLREGLRHAGAAAAAASSSGGSAPGVDMSASSAPSLSGIAWDAVDQRLKRAIDDLPFNHKVVFLLSAVEGLRYREIADAVGVPVGTVMSRLHRARCTLASQLRDVAAEHGLRGSGGAGGSGDGGTGAGGKVSKEEMNPSS